MATARLPQIKTQNMPMALFCYLVLTWFPLLISALMLATWNLVSGDNLPILRLVVFLVILRQINVFTISTLFHRSYAHRQFQYHPLVEHPMRVWNWMWAGTGGRAWAIMHRWHHAAADTEQDPHSPTKTGGSLRNITAQTFKSYQVCLHNEDQFRRYEYKLPDDAFERFVRKLESKGIWGLVVVRLPLVLAVMTPFIGFPAAVCALPGIMGAVWFSTVIIVNGLCHVMGYQVMDSGDTSTNLFPIDLLGWGEALHHNHHYQQGKANMAIAWFEWDPGYATLWLLSKVGVVRNLRA